MKIGGTQRSVFLQTALRACRREESLMKQVREKGLGSRGLRSTRSARVPREPKVLAELGAAQRRFSHGTKGSRTNRIAPKIRRPSFRRCADARADVGIPGPLHRYIPEDEGRAAGSGAVEVQDLHVEATRDSPDHHVGLPVRGYGVASTHRRVALENGEPRHR